MLVSVAIGDEIKKARKEAGLTQVELALKCQSLNSPIIQNDISNYERGLLNPSLERIETIAKALGKEWVLK